MQRCISAIAVNLLQQYYSYILHIYVISEETNCKCCTADYLFTYCCLLLPIIRVALLYGYFYIIVRPSVCLSSVCL